MRCKSEERGLKKQPLSADKSLQCRRHKDRVLRQDSAQSSAVNHSLLGLFRRAWAMDRQPPTYQLFTSYNFRDQEPPKAPLNFRCPHTGACQSASSASEQGVTSNPKDTKDGITYRNSHKPMLLCAMFSENFLEEMLPCYADHD